MAPYLRMADVIIAGVGVKHLIRADDVKPGAAVLDVGVTREDDPETGKSKSSATCIPTSQRSPVICIRYPGAWRR